MSGEEHAILQATFCGLRTVANRKGTALTFEVPWEHTERVLKVLGHPDPMNPKWVNIGLMTPELAEEMMKAKAAKQPVPNQSSPVNTREKNKRPLASRAGYLCSKPPFWRFLEEKNSLAAGHIFDAEAAAGFVRLYCGVQSRAEFATNAEAAVAFTELAAEYEAWMMDV